MPSGRSGSKSNGSRAKSAAGTGYAGFNRYSYAVAPAQVNLVVVELTIGIALNPRGDANILKNNAPTAPTP